MKKTRNIKHKYFTCTKTSQADNKILAKVVFFFLYLIVTIHLIGFYLCLNSKFSLQFYSTWIFKKKQIKRRGRTKINWLLQKYFHSYIVVTHIFSKGKCFLKDNFKKFVLIIIYKNIILTLSEKNIALFKQICKFWTMNDLFILGKNKNESNEI